MPAALLAIVLCGTVSAVPAPPATHPTQADIERAVEKVKADPNLATERTIKMLRWKQQATPGPSRTPGWLTWIVGLFRWVDQSSRYLLWAAAILVVGFLTAYVVDVVRRHRTRSPGERPFVAPTHVQDLDIRPESLPDDVGAAARQLWDSGEHRVALALLYRGLLSRFAHNFEIPIRDSSTEGDCLSLAARHLSAGQSDYSARLIGEWQRFVYGRGDLQTAVVYALCDGFAQALDRTSRVNAADPGAAS